MRIQCLPLIQFDNPLKLSGLDGIRVYNEAIKIKKEKFQRLSQPGSRYTVHSIAGLTKYFTIRIYVRSRVVENFVSNHIEYLLGFKIEIGDLEADWISF